jgi:hypothetical protein
MNVKIFRYNVIFKLFIRRWFQSRAQILQNERRQNVQIVVHIMQMQVMNFLQTNLNDHDVFWAKHVLQIVDEDTFDDEHAYLNEIFLHFDRVRIKQKMIIFQKIMRHVRVNVDL